MGEECQYMSHIQFVPLMKYPKSLYTDNNDDDYYNDATAQLHILSWPHGQISQKRETLLLADVYIFLQK